jgi:hypothetical protein
MNTTSINDNAIDLFGLSLALVYYDNQLYISYKNWFSGYQYIMVTDINGQYIKTYALMETFFLLFKLYFFPMNSFTVDNFGNILFTSMGQLCLFDSSLNITKSCIDNLNYNEYNAIYGFSNDYPLHAEEDQSARLVAIDSFKQKIQLYGPFGNLKGNLSLEQKKILQTNIIVIINFIVIFIFRKEYIPFFKACKFTNKINLSGLVSCQFTTS